MEEFGRNVSAVTGHLEALAEVELVPVVGVLSRQDLSMNIPRVANIQPKAEQAALVRHQWITGKDGRHVRGTAGCQNG